MGNNLSGEQRRIRYALNHQLAQEGKKQCSVCHEIKTFQEFYPNRSSGSNPYSCRCIQCDKDKLYRSNQRKAAKRRLSYKHKCELCDKPISADRNTQGFCCKKHRMFVWQVRQYHGTLQDARYLYEITQCEVCGSNRNLCIDHSHSNGKWRGRLCRDCNFALGHYYESIDTMQSAIDYLSNPIVIPDREYQRDRTHCRLCGTTLDNPHPNRIYCSYACKARSSLLHNNFNITPEQYKWLLSRQGDKCACCHKDMDDPCVDHDHDTGRVRGLLCFNCNIALGHNQDDIKIIKRLTQYLETHQSSDNWQNWSVRSLDSRTVRTIARERHYLHRNPNVSFGFGLYRDDDLMGICSFGSPSSVRITKSVCPTDHKKVIELNRLWIDNDAPKLAASWFVSRCLKQLPPRIVISYADTGIRDELHNRFHDGTIYKALNFHSAGQSKASVDWRIPGTTRNVGKDVEGSVAYEVPVKNRYWITTGNRKERRNLASICRWREYGN